MPGQRTSGQTNRSRWGNPGVGLSSPAQQKTPELSEANYTVPAGAPYQLSSRKVHGGQKQD